MSTFENGWICRECWSANRENDDRCYRCKVDRPLGAPVTTTSKATASPAAPIEEPPAVQATEPALASVTAAAPVRAGRYCLRCGAVMRPGAAFCTQCGTAAAEAIAAAEASEDADKNVPGSGTSPSRMPQLTLPQLHPGAAIERLRSRFLEYHATRERRWEMVMSALAVAFFLAGLAAGATSGVLHGALNLFSLAVTVVFVAEYAARLAADRDRRGFVVNHLLELAALVPLLRLLRVGRLAWVAGLRTAFNHARGWRIRQPLAPPNGRRARLVMLWFALLVITGVAALGYSTGDAAGSSARFALVVMLLCVFSGLTAALATAFAGTATAVADVPERLRILGGLKSSNLISAQEYDLHRAALMQLLSPAEPGRTPMSAAGYVGTAADRTAHGTSAS